VLSCFLCVKKTAVEVEFNVPAALYRLPRSRPVDPIRPVKDELLRPLRNLSIAAAIVLNVTPVTPVSRYSKRSSIIERKISRP
jgi:hypothetical protein